MMAYNGLPIFDVEECDFLLVAGCKHSPSVRLLAKQIVDKKLRELQQKLTNKKVELTLSDEARALLLKRGFTREYGAREMDRVIGHDVKPLLMRELLFGKLRKGGKAVLTADGDTLKVNVNRR